MRRRIPVFAVLLFGLSAAVACAFGAGFNPSPAPTSVTIISSATPEAKQLPSPTAPATASPEAGVTPTNAPPTETATIVVEASPTPVSGAPTPSVPPTSVAPAGNFIPHLAAGQPITVTMIHMLAETSGWAIGVSAAEVNDHVLRTGDGGATWRDVTPPEPPDPAQVKRATAHFMDANNAWVTYAADIPAPPAGPIGVWVTHDGGQTWTFGQPLDLGGGAYYRPTDLVFADAQTGWVLAHVDAGMSHDYVEIFATTDGGTHWARIVDPTLDNLKMSCGKNGMLFVNVQTGWVTGDCYGVVPGAPYLQATTDGGHTWQALALAPPADAPDLFMKESNACGTDHLAFASPSSGVVVVKCSLYDFNPPQAGAWLYITSDGGQTWNPLPLPTPYGTLQFVGPSGGWWLSSPGPDGSGDYQLYRTADGGQTWSAIKKVSWTGQLDFVTEQTGWVVVVKDGLAAALVRTDNGGAKWAELKPVIAP